MSYSLKEPKSGLIAKVVRWILKHVFRYAMGGNTCRECHGTWQYMTGPRIKFYTDFKRISNRFSLKFWRVQNPWMTHIVTGCRCYAEKNGKVSAFIKWLGKIGYPHGKCWCS